MLFFTHSQIRNGVIYFHQILHIHFLGGHSDIFESPSKLIQGFWEGGGSKIWRRVLILALASNTVYCATAHTRDVPSDESDTCNVI